MKRTNLENANEKKAERLYYEKLQISISKLQQDIVTASTPTNGEGKTFRNYSEDNWF